MEQRKTRIEGWLVVGVGGATCSGKTTLAKKLGENLKNCTIINQDDYFLPVNDPRHTFIPELNHINWELLTSLDMEKMIKDVREILQPPMEKSKKRGETRILILEGLLLFNSKEIAEVCDLRYFIDLNKEECWRRRQTRVYDPPDVPNYFEKIVWPEYLRAKMEIFENKDLCRSITFLDGTMRIEENFSKVFEDVKKLYPMIFPT